MNRATSTLLSIGASALLIAVGIWFLYDCNTEMWLGKGSWALGHRAMMGGGMGIFMIPFWIILISVLVLLISGVINWRRGAEDTPNALEIIKTRYARGEIDKAEYEDKLRDLDV